jgi:hypothetical protein
MTIEKIDYLTIKIETLIVFFNYVNSLLESRVAKYVETYVEKEVSVNLDAVFKPRDSRSWITAGDTYEYDLPA